MDTMETPPKLKYKNVSEQTQALIGYGEIEPDETIEVEEVIENPNLQPQAQEDTFVGVVPVTKPKRNK